MIIDAHSHVHDPVHSHIALLDEAGVDHAVVFATRPHPERAETIADLKREMSSLTAAMNTPSAGRDGVQTAWRELDAALLEHPDRLIGFRSLQLDLPASDIAAAVQHDVVEAGFQGIGELTTPPDRARLIEPVLRAAADHDALPVVVHGSAPTTAADISELIDLAHRYPRTPLVISQLAGAHWLTAIEAARTTPNLYLELSTASIVFAVRLAISEVPERTLFGSDAPYGDPAVSRLTIERVTSPGEVRDRVLGETLAQMLRL